VASSYTAERLKGSRWTHTPLRLALPLARGGVSSFPHTPSRIGYFPILYNPQPDTPSLEAKM
jgi:hypothetical protein